MSGPDLQTCKQRTATCTGCPSPKMRLRWWPRTRPAGFHNRGHSSAPSPNMPPSDRPLRETAWNWIIPGGMNIHWTGLPPLRRNDRGGGGGHWRHAPEGGG